VNDDDTDVTPARRALPIDPGITVARATPVDPPPPAPTSVQRAKLAPGAANQYEGQATMFADDHDLENYHTAKAKALAAGKTEQQAEQAGLLAGDNWQGAPALGGINTGTHYGVAVPEEYLQRHFGNDHAAWRTARAEVNYNGQSVLAPFIDIGPGKGPQAKGVRMDISNLLQQGLGGSDVKSDNVKYNIIPNAGPDALKDPDKFKQEQDAFRNRFKDNPAAQIASEPAPTPWTGLGGAAGTPGAHGSPPAPQTPDENDDDGSGYDQSSQHHLGGPWGAINA
jgi:hypothetical protein